MQTEHRCGNYNFDSPYWDKTRYNANMPQNDHLYGEESWQLIRDWIVVGRELVQRLEHGARHRGQEPGQLAAERAAGRGPVREEADRDARLLRLPPLLPVHRVGATRIGTTGSTDALAFKNPDGSVIVQVYNKGAASKTMIVGIGSALSQALYQFDVPPTAGIPSAFRRDDLAASWVRMSP